MKRMVKDSEPRDLATELEKEAIKQRENEQKGSLRKKSQFPHIID